MRHAFALRIASALALLGQLGLIDAAGVVTLSLASPQAALEVDPGAPIEWSITAAVSPDGGLGLALVVVDLSQDEANPEKLDLSPASGVPEGMEVFSRPLGISNPGEGGLETGYVGVQRGAPGTRDLVQIGGAQSTLGTAGTAMGTNTAVVEGVGLAAPLIVASGVFTAPTTPGSYSFRLQNGLANDLDQVSPPPTASRASAADAVLDPGSFSFTVAGDPKPCATGCFIRGDCNGDGAVTGSVTDVVFLLGYNFLGGAEPPCLSACDVDGDGQVQGSVTDAVYLLQFNFLGGSGPPPPFPFCGEGRAPDLGLGCALPPEICR